MSDAEQTTLSERWRAGDASGGEGKTDDPTGATTRSADLSAAETGRAIDGGWRDWGVPDDARECQGCGQEMPEYVREHLGDQHGRVPVCKDCWEGRCDTRSSGAETHASAIAAYRMDQHGVGGGMPTEVPDA